MVEEQEFGHLDGNLSWPSFRRVTSAGNEICVSETLGVVEYGDDSGRNAEYADFVRSWHRSWQGDLRILQWEHTQNLARLGSIDHRLRVRRHGQTGDRHQIRRVVINRQRHPIILHQIPRLLAVQAAQEVESEAFVHVADGRRVWPAIRP